MGEIQRFAKENNLFIIEDVAQAFGAEYVADGRWQMADGRRKLGTIGNCGAFSFFPSKNLGAYGDAGVVVTNDKKIAEFATILRSHGQSRHYNAKYLGYNSRLDSLQAAILLAKLKYIDKFNQRRIEIAQKYHTCLKEAKFLQLPALYEGLVARDLRHVYNLYTIKVESAIREELLKFLNRAGIGARVYYPLPLHKMQAFKTAKIPHSLRISEKVAKSVLSLPINPFLRSQEIEYTCKIIKSFKKQPI
jgi:dTDP-4-amino-4,6-dideoxygalactose transaminase